MNRQYFIRGIAANLPVSASVFAYGSVLGVIASQKLISIPLLMVMNLSVFAGAAQFIMVDMWHHPLPLFEMLSAVFVINFRYLLIGASLRPLFVHKTLFQKARSMHLVADENWAVTISAMKQKRASVEFLFGGGLFLLVVWSAGTITGHALGAVIQSPEKWGLDFAFTAVFTALAMGLWRGKIDILPWVVTAVVSYLAFLWIPGKWYVAIGSISGAVAGALCASSCHEGGTE